MSRKSSARQINVRIPSTLKAQLDVYTRLTGRSLAFVATTALRDYLAWRIPQLEQLKGRLREADEGKFASKKEVEAVMKKWGHVRA